MRLIFTPALILLLLQPALAQRNLEVGLATGSTIFHGDLGNTKGPVQWQSARPAMQITFRDFLNNPKRYITRAIDVEARMGWYRLGYEEADMIKGVEVRDLRNYRRGLGFRTDLFGASGHVVLNAYREPYQPLFQQRFFMYFHVGLGVYYGRPRADLFNGDINIDNRYHYWGDGTVRDAPRGTPEEETNIIERDGSYETDLYDWVTESGSMRDEGGSSSRFSPWHIGIPMGGGVRYMLTRQLSVGIEFTYIGFFSDMLDGVSGDYVTDAELEAAYPNDPERQALARYISDPTGWGSNGVEGPVTSRRGNPLLNDAFSFIGMELSYKFKRKPTRRSFVTL